MRLQAAVVAQDTRLIVLRGMHAAYLRMEPDQRPRTVVTSHLPSTRLQRKVHATGLWLGVKDSGYFGVHLHQH